MSSVFHQLNPTIQTLLATQDIHHPTEPQRKAIPVILNGSHVLLLAPTGHGKTEAALLPVFHQFLDHIQQHPPEKKHPGFSIIYITPLRALNRDMLNRTFSWGKEFDISIAVRHGDTTQSERARQSRQPPDMLITTPETFQILFTGKRLRQHLHQVRWVIIDEIHELAHNERGAQLSVGLERLQELTTASGHDFQRIGLSATVGAAGEVSRFLGGVDHGSFRDVEIIDVDAIKHTNIQVELPSITESDQTMSSTRTMEPMSFATLKRCEQLISDHVSTLLFINTRDGAEILASRFHLWKPEYPIGVHHGSLAKHARIEAEDQFKDGRLRSLICTSSLELGINVGNTDFIIQYNSPREVTRIVQRIGRSGHRIGEISDGIILATTPEDLAESLVIARRMLAGELEVFSVRKNPLSVLSNQIISIALASGRIHQDHLYKILTRSYPFHPLSRKQFESIIKQLQSQRSIWVEESFIGKRRNSRKYFLDNISMIADEKTYDAVDISSRKKIGTLDERFVLNHGFEGAKFILNGRPWTIIKAEEDEILIAQSKELGEVPSWAGEDIPVPYAVAQEVGSLRRQIAKNEQITDYPCDQTMMIPLLEVIQKQKDEGFIVPDDETITLEVQQHLMIINICCGTKVNETLGRIISALLAQSIGESIGITSDAYRILLELPGSIKADRIKTILQTIKSDSLWYLLHTILRNSTYIRWQLVHSARKFGALRKDFDYKNVGVKRLFALFGHTLIMDEAIDKLIWERMDIDHTKEVLEKIQNGSIDVIVQGISPIGASGGETMRGLMVPARPDRSILMALNKRLDETSITLACTNCHHLWITTVSRAPDHPKCRRCGAIKIAAIPSYRDNEIALFKKKKLSSQEKHEYRRLLKNASLILTYGKTAIRCLMGRGIGPDTAARILRKYDPVELKKQEESQMKFLRDIHKAEVHYAKTKGFWDT